jgi:hypothetical protein
LVQINIEKYNKRIRLMFNDSLYFTLIFATRSFNFYLSHSSLIHASPFLLIRHFCRPLALLLSTMKTLNLLMHRKLLKLTPPSSNPPSFLSQLFPSTFSSPLPMSPLIIDSSIHPLTHLMKDLNFIHFSLELISWLY